MHWWRKKQIERWCFAFSASLKTVFVDKAENILALLKIVEQLPTLKRIVMTKKLATDKETEIQKKAKDAGIQLYTYNQLRVRIDRILLYWFVIMNHLGHGTS